MLKGIVFALVVLIGIYLLIDYQVVNLSQVENLGSRGIDWIIDKYQKAKEVFNW